MGDLSNNVIYSKSANKIKYLRHTSPELFKSANVILYLHKLVNNINYSVNAYKLIFNVFDLDVDLFELETTTVSKYTRNVLQRPANKQKLDPDVDKRLAKRLLKGNDTESGFHRD